jgi:geranylgeranyl diphosphate synthase type II
MPALAIDGSAFLQVGRKLVDRLLDGHLPPESAEPRSLHAALRYSVLAGGKRLRPLLALAAWEYCGGRTDGEDLPIHRAMVALEMVHTYSLIHDDLPCMDDDDLRRGIPTCHKKFGEAVAVLAGDALHDIAFELMASTGRTEPVIELARAIGTQGMLGGQIADIEAEGRDLDETDIVEIHRRKTGALIRCAVRVGAILAEAPPERLARISRFGEKVGLAFQVIDDILDIEGDQKLLGKKVGSDSKNLKATYPGVVGMAQAREEAGRLIEQAITALGEEGDNVLKQIALYIGQRRN